MTAPDRMSQIADLYNRWNTISGFSFAIPDWMLHNIADDAKGISNLYEFGQYIASQVSLGNLTSATAFGGMMPWAWYGMSATDYHSALLNYDDAFRNLTGQSAPPDLVTRALHEHEGVMSGSQFTNWLLAQETVKQTYGWLRYGLDWQQFQQQKQQWRNAFGRDLSDAEAVAQLQYAHSAQGPNMAVDVVPTFTQQEKKAVQTGVAGSVVR